ncbi:exopolysaccharide biosynthesis polyprenyl glycosylphosphotransferase [Polaribacter haliotis]|uniref:Exopolysaccharide biosynthesis polyprenyl glycosylphosphotransferase n=1 Tax=Polaribacter haliotis TaxID=1888915 RepID=A0A7L8AI87_9FLAO|nr:exopolysaccharide biosynthesis polyprenyl glycosylphosphotransferase [Polaribacter haliotis]QOD61499.1 exopolysaccharide biosynthesis polyprenyl glycosylphosphotransferase [Polaribacter haliotis]
MKRKSGYIDISERKILLRIIDLVIIICSIYFVSIYFDFSYINIAKESIYLWLSVLSLYFILFGEIFQLYNINVSNNRYTVVRSIVLTAFTTTVFYIFTPFFSPSLPANRLQIVYFFLVLTVPVILWRFIYILTIFSPKYFKTVVFVGHSDKISKMLKQINNDNFHNIKAYFSDKEIEGVKGFHDISKTNLNDLEIGENINEVIVSKEGLSANISKSLNLGLITLFQKGVNIVSFGKFYEDVTVRVPREYLSSNFYDHINFSKNNTNRFYLFGLRAIDILVSIFGIIIFVLLIPFVFISNLFGNRGSMFYSQTRVGKNGKHFKIFKLRSMVKNAETGKAIWAEKNDTRITTFGKFLRNTRLDEVPQFYNILKGDMSIIGPRPERPEFVKDLESQIPFYAIRHVIRPGLTGWAQVNYPYANTMEEQETKLRYDLYYIKERNAFLDFKILIKTVTTILFFRGQ